MGGAIAEHGGHGGQKFGRLWKREAWIRPPKGIHPADFRTQNQDLTKSVEGADDEYTDDQAVEAGVGHKGFGELRQENKAEKAHQR